MPRETFDLISSTTTTGIVGSITFSSIPTTFTDLVIVTRHKHATLTSNSLGMVINGDTGAGNYSWTYFFDNGTTTSQGGRNINYTFFYPGWFVTAGTTEGTVSVIHLNDYSNTTTYKAYVSRTNGYSSSTSYPGVELNTGTWRSTAAVTSLQFLIGGDFAADSVISLYGVRAE